MGNAKSDKITIRIEPKKKEKLINIAESLDMSLSEYINSVIEYSIYNKRNYIYNDKLCGLMLDHMNTIIAMEESEERTALQREVREILCLLSK